MVSKELLSEILGIKIYHCKKVAQTSIIRYKFDAIGEVRDSSINIYELAHKCKEWAFRLEYTLQSATVEDGKTAIGCGLCIIQERINYNDFSKDVEATTEPEAIFRACQWILDNKDNT